MTTDVAKIANGLSRPGIDPRKFVDLGIVIAVDVTSRGIHVDFLSSEGVRETGAVSPPYGGPGYGLHFPIDVERVAVIALPDGKFNAGARVVGTVWDEGDPPPADVIDHPDDVVLVVKGGQKLRLIVSEGADVIIEARDGGKIRLGGENANDPVARKSDLDALKAKFNALVTAHNTHVHQVPGVTSGVAVANAAPTAIQAQQQGPLECSSVSTTK